MANRYLYTTPISVRDAQGEVAAIYAQLRRDLGSVAEPVALHAPLPDLLGGAWAILRETLGEDVEHRCNQYLNNRMEQDHRGIKQRYYPMRGFGSFESAARFCQAFDELRQFERYRRTRKEQGSLKERRQRFRDGTAALQAMVLAA